MQENSSYDSVFAFLESANVKITDEDGNLKRLPVVLSELDNVLGHFYFGDTGKAIQLIIRAYKDDADEFLKRYNDYNKDELDEFLSNFKIKGVD